MASPSLLPHRSTSLPAILARESVLLRYEGNAGLTNCATLGDWRPDRQAVSERAAEVAAAQTGGMRKSFWEWLRPRLGTGPATALIGLYLLCMLARNVMLRHLHWLSPSNAIPAMTLASALSLVVALVVTVVMEGPAALRRIFTLRGIRPWLPIALMSIAALPCLFAATKVFHASLGTSFILGQLAVPVAAVLSQVVMRRSYGVLDALSIAIITLASVVLMTLRSDGLHESDVMATLDWRSSSLLMCHLVLYIMASTYAERIFKNRHLHEGRIVRIDEPEFFYIYKARQDVANLALCGLCWSLQESFLTRGSSLEGTSVAQVVLWTIENVANFWLAGLLAKYFSTVSRGIVEAISFNVSILMIDPLLGDGSFQSGGVVGAFLAIMTFISAMVFQTGRLIIVALRDSMNLQLSSPGWRLQLPRLEWRSAKATLVKYSAMVLFILSDAARQLSQATVLGKLMLTPQTFVFITYVIGVLVAMVTTIATSDSFSSCAKDIGSALHPRVILRYLPCGFLFGAASVFTALAFSFGISASLNTAIGYIYTPLSALASAFVLGKYYMWLEWFALSILTCALVVFGLLSSYFSGRDGGSSSLVGIICVAASALTSVMASLVSEKLLKGENKPFHVQKIALDFGSALSILLSLPAIGILEADPKYAFWKERPLSQTCGVDICWEVGDGKGCSSADCTCECGAGFFVAWSSWLILIALVINVAQGWLTGVVIKQFSTVGRALAQSFTLLTIYFIGDPLFNTGAPHNLSLTLVTLTIPLSNQIFVKAVSEMEKMMDPDTSAESCAERGDDLTSQGSSYTDSATRAQVACITPGNGLAAGKTIREAIPTLSFQRAASH
eukprot:TRINITY_DN28193_c0_g1_i1.p1 TRINITY_DN28193_c0_g1~~TRINITY_DN28193_c0_g1_i1.p1  ORF type:complete len:845 (-),score=153.31 TRINITY_DN28193_c0_g1_i1:58-2592(-)